MTYTSLEQRMAQAYIDMLPAFVPDENASVSASEQEKFYVLIKKLYQLAFDEPLLFIASLHEDDAYPNRFNNKSSYGKPDLQVNMKKFLKTVDTLLENMLIMGQGSEVKLNNRQEIILLKLGIEDFTNLLPAWIWMSTRPDANLTDFSYCLFKKDYPYTSDIYARLLGEESFRKLENWMTAQGYKRFDIYNMTASECKLSLTYANPAWSADPPNGGFEYKIKHTGISARYDFCFKTPVVFGLCIPKGMMKTFIDSFNVMDEKLKRFFIKHTIKCRNCRYCVQTDKTGLRHKACVPAIYEQREYSLCTYFSGCGYCWTSIDDELTERLIEMLTFMDNFIPNQAANR